MPQSAVRSLKIGSGLDSTAVGVTPTLGVLFREQPVVKQTSGMAGPKAAISQKRKRRNILLPPGGRRVRPAGRRQDADGQADSSSVRSAPGLGSVLRRAATVRERGRKNRSLTVAALRSDGSNVVARHGLLSESAQFD